MGSTPSRVGVRGVVSRAALQDGSIFFCIGRYEANTGYFPSTLINSSSWSQTDGIEKLPPAGK